MFCVLLLAAATASFQGERQIRRDRLRQPRRFRPRSALEELSDTDVRELFRLNRQAILALYTCIAHDLEPLTGRSQAIPGIVKLLAVLNFLATGNFQPSVARVIGISRSTFSRLLKPVLRAIVQHSPKFVCFPSTPEQWQEVKSGFYNLGGMPNCIGAIDCTHILLTPPHATEEQFRNRKHTHSLNVQVVCDSHQRIMSIHSGFPGSCHDSYILRQSALFDRFQLGLMPEGWLVGDAGYGSKPWLLIPVSNPRTPAEVKFNTAHIKTRGVIERTFGVLKSTFRCLSKSGGCLQYSPETVSQIIQACAVLNNVALDHGVNLETNEELPPEIPGYPAVSQDSSDEGKRVRSHLITSFFQCKFLDM
ncbi:putative nuclease HARBI1 [Xenopus laevis]|uniref:Putative nuclease HARBI1 n=1 Tax=Xenopus laevis TaxID=8355 RepID=A0A8J1KWH0_XENLA|nr:putative nuclease HARBI1 [Xenopus laevis]